MPWKGKQLDLGTFPGPGLPAEARRWRGGLGGLQLNAVRSWLWDRLAASSISHTSSPGDTGPCPGSGALQRAGEVRTTRSQAEGPFQFLQQPSPGHRCQPRGVGIPFYGLRSGCTLAGSHLNRKSLEESRVSGGRPCPPDRGSAPGGRAAFLTLLLQVRAVCFKLWEHVQGGTGRIGAWGCCGVRQQHPAPLAPDSALHGPQVSCVPERAGPPACSLGGRLWPVRTPPPAHRPL